MSSAARSGLRAGLCHRTPLSLRGDPCWLSARSRILATGIVRRCRARDPNSGISSYRRTQGRLAWAGRRGGLFPAPAGRSRRAIRSTKSSTITAGPTTTRRPLRSSWGSSRNPLPGHPRAWWALPYPAAVAVWYLINVVCLFAALHIWAKAVERARPIAAKSCYLRRPLALVIGPLLALLPFIGDGLARGQPTPVPLLLIVLFLSRYAEKRPAAASFALSLAVTTRFSRSCSPSSRSRDAIGDLRSGRRLVRPSLGRIAGGLRRAG